MSVEAPRRGPAMDERIRQRRSQVLRERASRRRRATASVVSLLLLAALAVGVARSPLFAIVEVQVAGVAGQQAEAVRKTGGLRVGENLLAADLAGAGQRITDLPWVREATVARVPPSTVQITVVPREAVAVVNITGASWLVDTSGVVIAGGSREGLVEIDAADSVMPGPGVQVSDAAVRNALSVREQLPASLRDAVVRYDAPSERGLRLQLDGGTWVRFGLAERVEMKAEVITALLAQAADHGEGVGVAEMDVRAPDNPVLVPVSESSGS